MASAGAAAVQIRWLMPDDAPAFQALRLAGLQEAPTAFGSSYEEEQSLTLETVRQRLVVQADRGILGAFSGDALVGTLGVLQQTAMKSRHKWLIWGVYVAPAQRSAGLARALLHQALDFVRMQPGARLVNLSVNASNASALRLYRAAGFAVYGTEPQALCINGVLHDEHLMQLQLRHS